ncbi:hypothetical protein UlMin_005516 [Ulmus minor]
MGCVSSKLLRKQLKQETTLDNGGECLNHVVSLTSSTYGLLQLENEQPIRKVVVTETKNAQRSPPREKPEVINAWELMEDLEEGIPISNQAKKSPKSSLLLRGFADIDSKSPLKFLNKFGSPRKAKRSGGGKENRGRINQNGNLDFSPNQVFRARNSTDNPCKAVLSLSFSVKGSPIVGKRESFEDNSDHRSWKSFSPLFDPELVSSYEKELSVEEEQIKRVISPSPKARKTRKSSQKSDSILLCYPKKCPPGGENSVVFYTTTLRGIRKTFEDCNRVRSIIESHLIQMFERDISMDSGFKEELRGLMGTKEVKVPLVFVRGRLIGGGDEVVKLEEEGKLGILFEGLPSSLGGCKGCAGFRFVMCALCNGSCKVLDEELKKMVRCGECNENGLVQCPVCC